VVVDGALVVTVTVVGGLVAFVPDDDRAGFQMLKNQNDGSVIGADSGPIIIHLIFCINTLFLSLTTKFSTACNT
jgi:hypothetical protein